MKTYLIKHRRALGYIGSVFALIIASIYLVVVPGEANETMGIPKAILTYAHSVCWFLLSPAIFLWGINKKPKLKAALAYSALGTYALFIGTLLVSNFS